MDCLFIKPSAFHWLIDQIFRVTVNMVKETGNFHYSLYHVLWNEIDCENCDKNILVKLRKDWKKEWKNSFNYNIRTKRGNSLIFQHCRGAQVQTLCIYVRRVLQAPPPHVSDGAVWVCANWYTTCLIEICISDAGSILAGPPLVVSILYIYPFIWIILQSNNFCTECIFNLVCILFTDLIKAYVFLFLFYSTFLENYFRGQYRKLGN